MSNLRLNVHSPGTELQEATQFPWSDYALYGENGLANVFEAPPRSSPEAIYGYYEASPRVFRASFAPEGWRKGPSGEGSGPGFQSEAVSDLSEHGAELRYGRRSATQSVTPSTGVNGSREERYGQEQATQSGSRSEEDQTFTAVRHITNIVRAAAERCPQLLTDGTDEALTGLMGARQQLLGWLQTHSNVDNSLPTQIPLSMSTTPPIQSDREWSASTTDEYRETPPLWSVGSAYDGSALDSFSDSSEDITPRSGRSQPPFSFFPSSVDPPNTHSLDTYGSFDTNTLIPLAKRPRLHSLDSPPPLPTSTHSSHALVSPNNALIVSSSASQSPNLRAHRDSTSDAFSAPPITSDSHRASHSAQHHATVPPLRLPLVGTEQSQHRQSEISSSSMQAGLNHDSPSSRKTRDIGHIYPSESTGVSPYTSAPRWLTSSHDSASSSVVSHTNAPPYHPLTKVVPFPSHNMSQNHIPMHQRQGEPSNMSHRSHEAPLASPSTHSPGTPSSHHHQIPYSQYYNGTHTMPGGMPTLQPAFVRPNASFNEYGTPQWGPSHYRAPGSEREGVSTYYPGEQLPSFVSNSQHAPAHLHHLHPSSMGSPRLPSHSQEHQNQSRSRSGRTMDTGGHSLEFGTLSPVYSTMPHHLSSLAAPSMFYGETSGRMGPFDVHGNAYYATEAQQRMAAGMAPPQLRNAHPSASSAEVALDTPLITKTVSKTGRPLPPVTMFKVKPSKSTRLPQVDPNAPAPSLRTGGHSKMPASLASMIAPGLIDSFDWRKPTASSSSKKRTHAIANQSAAAHAGSSNGSGGNGGNGGGGGSFGNFGSIQNVSGALQSNGNNGSASFRASTQGQVMSNTHMTANDAMARMIASSAPSVPINLRDFIILGVLGTGTFGKVHLCYHPMSHQYYCMKILKKQTIFRFKQMDHIVNEKQLLTQLRHPGIVQLFATFSTQDALLLLMEYVPGGELFFYIRKYGRLPEEIARWYAAELVLTILHLHERQIVYRDLKPENILLDSMGHLKLADFGFAKRVIDKTWTMCGTPDYLAPEIITGRGHDTAVDWWSLGVLIFEMLAGFPPFTDKDMPTLFRKIQEPDRLYIPVDFSQEAADLVRRLLVVDPTRRLGNIHPDISDIRTHPWFRPINWEQIQQRLLPGPIIPILPNPSEIALQDHDDPNANQQAPAPVHIPEDVQRLFDRF